MSRQCWTMTLSFSLGLICSLNEASKRHVRQSRCRTPPRHVTTGRNSCFPSHLLFVNEHILNEEVKTVKTHRTRQRHKGVRERLALHALGRRGWGGGQARDFTPPLITPCSGRQAPIKLNLPGKMCIIIARRLCSKSHPLQHHQGNVLETIYVHVRGNVPYNIKKVTCCRSVTFIFFGSLGKAT